ncbi:MAG: hypothetical protein ACOYMW_16340, partial [Candidatus Competibacteraceae bacterium]
FTPPVNPEFTPPVNPEFTRTSQLTPQGTTHRNAPCERAQAPDTHTTPPSAPRVEPTPATTEPAATEPTATALPEPTAPAKPARQAKVAKAVKVAAEPLPDAPEWIPTDLWQAYIDHRKAKGKDKALTASSATLTLKQLEKAKGFGHDPVALVESAIANGWTGCVFDKHLKPAPTTPTAATPLNGQSRPVTKHDHLVESSRQAIEIWLASNNANANANVIEGECYEIH